MNRLRALAMKGSHMTPAEYAEFRRLFAAENRRRQAAQAVAPARSRVARATVPHAAAPTRSAPVGASRKPARNRAKATALIRARQDAYMHQRGAQLLGIG